MKIAMAISEIVPFAKTGGLADAGYALSLELDRLGHQVIVIMPKYRCVAESKFKIIRVSKDVFCAKIGKNIKVYFIENNAYFDRDDLYVDKEGDYSDNLERFSFFCLRGLDLLKEIDFCPDILHLHDWQGSLMAVYLKSVYAKQNFYKNIKSVLTIHNIGYQGIFAREEFPVLGLDWKFFDVNGLEFYNKVNLLKGGIIFADLINTVSPTYAGQIQEKEFGFGLEGLLIERKNDLSGILNGLDYSTWSPATDKFIFKKFSASCPEGKLFNKEDLQVSCGLAVNKDIPVFGMVSRLAEQKGFDILIRGLDEICKMELQLVILGVGDLKYQQLLKIFAKKYPGKISLNLRFDDPLAHKIYAGSDFFLMPSGYEPCGLGQMISLSYGTIPVVFKTGGLADTVDKNNGFVFTEYTQEGLQKIIQKALLVFKNKDKWKSLVANALKCDFSWKDAADKYLRLYAKAKEK